MRTQVYINPLVAGLPQHAHIFSEGGCPKGRLDEDPDNGVDCEVILLFLRYLTVYTVILTCFFDQ